MDVIKLQSNDFEKAYGDFIDNWEYDKMQNLLFSLIRTSFTAGWQAAGGTPPIPYKIFEVLHRADQEDETNTPDIQEND